MWRLRAPELSQKAFDAWARPDWREGDLEAIFGTLDVAERQEPGVIEDARQAEGVYPSRMFSRAISVPRPADGRGLLAPEPPALRHAPPDAEPGHTPAHAVFADATRPEVRGVQAADPDTVGLRFTVPEPPQPQDDERVRVTIFGKDQLTNRFGDAIARLSAPSSPGSEDAA